jgi:acyl-CoA thioester hydrolase
VPPVVTTVRVRYAETDQMGVAHHGAYVAWLEEARIEWLRALGVNYRDLERDGVLMPVVDLRIAYKRPLRFDDLAELRTEGEATGPSRVSFRTQIRLSGEDAVRAEGLVVVAATTRDGRPTRVPPVVSATTPPMQR